MKLNSKRRTRASILPLLLLFVFCHASAQENSNLKISVNVTNQPLHLVLDDLASQYGFFFTFDSRLSDSRRIITMHLENISIQQAIDTLFQMPDLTYKIINKNIVVFPLIKGKNLVDEKRTEQKKTVTIYGVVEDIKSGKPMPYATISVLNSYFGTISNEDGSFVLRFPDTLNQPILISSFIGYKNQYTPISFESDTPVEIKMTRNMISLQEVIIRYKDPVGLLNESIKRIKTNYLNEPSGMYAYYREKVNKDDKCMVFSEAVVEIAKPGYNNRIATEKTRLLKGRKISNIDEQDTIVFKIRSGLNSMLSLDIIKNPPDFLRSDYLLFYKLHFSNVVSFKDKLVYVISFQQKEEIDETLFRGDLYIDRETLAILAADFEYDPLRIRNEADMFVAKKSNKVKVLPVSAQYHVEYKETDNSYYLSQVTGEVKFKVRKRRQWIASRYQINIEMAVTDIRPGQSPSIKYIEQLKSSSILSDQNFQYDPEFWGDYTTIIPESSLSEALLKIQKSMLEISFDEEDNE